MRKHYKVAVTELRYGIEYVLSSHKNVIDFSMMMQGKDLHRLVVG